VMLKRTEKKTLAEIINYVNYMLYVNYISSLSNRLLINDNTDMALDTALAL